MVEAHCPSVPVPRIDGGISLDAPPDQDPCYRLDVPVQPANYARG
jgi:hypothetical protein